MSEFLRKYWFVTLIGLAFVCVLIYFVIDLNKDNVSSKKADGQDVVASITLGDITSGELFDELEPNAANVLYNLYRNQIVDQAVEADAEMKSEAKTMARNIENNMKSDSTGKTRESILQTLASYGFTGDDAPYNYAMTSLKIRKLDADYIKKNFSDLKLFAPENGRTISIITMQVSNDEVLSTDAEEKQNAIQAALDEGKSFADVAKEYSEDEATAVNGGFYGYIDANSTDLDSSVISAALALENGGTSDWISVQPDAMSMFTLYKIHVEETDPEKLIASDNNDVIDAIVTSMTGSVNGLESKAVQAAKEGIDVTYENEDVEKMVNDIIQSQSDAFDSAKTTKEEELAAAEEEAAASSEENADSSSESAAEGE